MSETSEKLNFKYLVRIGAIACALGAILYASVRVLVPIDVHSVRLAEFLEIAEEIEVITLGNSHGRSFHFESMGMNGFHFFEQAGDIEEMERRADVVIELLPALRYVLIPLSPGALSISQRVVAEDYEERRLLVRKSTPATYDWRNYSLEEFVGTVVRRLFRIDSLQEHFLDRIGYSRETRTADARRAGPCFESSTSADPSALVYDVPEEGIVDGYRRLVMNQDCLQRYGGMSSRNRDAHIQATSKEYPNLQEENIHRILSLAGVLEARAVTLVLVNTPSTPWHYDSELTSRLKPRFESAITRLSAHPNIRYFDFHDLYYADLQGGENRYFFDDNHLALVGAKAFSAYFAERLEFTGDGENRPNPP